MGNLTSYIIQFRSTIAKFLSLQGRDVTNLYLRSIFRFF